MNEQPLLVTFALFAYKQEKFIAEAVRAALSQTYSPLEIIISDDCSPDRTFEIIKQEVENYSGPHTIRLNCNEQNEGVGEHINQVMAMVSGQLIVVAAGDDVSLPHRVETLVAQYEASGRTAMSLYSNATMIGEDGRVKRLFHVNSPDANSYKIERTMMPGSVVLGASHAWDRRVFDIFGPLPENIVFEDRAIPFRSALIGHIVYIEDPLVLYRYHGENISLGSTDYNQGKRDLFKSLLKTTEQEIQVLRCHLIDIASLERIYPQREEEAERLRKAAEISLEKLRCERIMLQNSSLQKKILTTLRMIAKGMPVRELVRWILVFFLPSLYLRRIRKLLKSTEENQTI